MLACLVLVPAQFAFGFVAAYVNTEEPSSAFLIDRRASLRFWVGPAIGVGTILYGLYSIVLGVRGVDPSTGTV